MLLLYFKPSRNRVIEFKQVIRLTEMNPNFEIIHNHIRSLGKQFCEFKILLTNLEYQLDCIVLTEIWQLPSLDLYQLSGYRII